MRCFIRWESYSDFHYFFQPYSQPYPFKHSSLPFSPTNLLPTSVIEPIKAASRAKWVKKFCDDRRCFDFFQLSWCINRNNSVHNHWFLINQTRKVGILQVAPSEEDTSDQIGKPSTPLYPMLSTYFHNFYTLPTPSNNLTRPCVPRYLLIFTIYTIFLSSFC